MSASQYPQPMHPGGQAGQAGIQPGLQPGSQTGVQPSFGQQATVQNSQLPQIRKTNANAVPEPPKWKDTLDAKETINQVTFMHEHKEWLDKLLLPAPPMAEILPKIFEHLTQESIRVLPSQYNDKLFDLFLRMGDNERREWCLQDPTHQTMVPRRIVVPRSISQADFTDATQRLWEVGHQLNCREIPEGREIERIAWELMGLHEAIGYNWMTIYRERALLVNSKTPNYFPAQPRDPLRPSDQQRPGDHQRPGSAAGQQARGAGPHPGNPGQHPGNSGHHRGISGQLPLPGNLWQYQGIPGQLPLPGQLPIPGSALQLPRQLPLPGSAVQLPGSAVQPPRTPFQPI
ncbi:hypothetical protein B0J13DRAFT_523404 [Dactylonectria estremocensis]|uniref:Uncharacterized protein n=1 Tax=Dactylonectria estremocensis TaxID=1079267 RepID=A0A9P9F1W6_9HYPO|nr:hypothetical protein B0J13DRAFT_523404 [Dactylonectria estremocensis]